MLHANAIAQRDLRHDIAVNREKKHVTRIIIGANVNMCNRVNQTQYRDLLDCVQEFVYLTKVTMEQVRHGGTEHTRQVGAERSLKLGEYCVDEKVVATNESAVVVAACWFRIRARVCMCKCMFVFVCLHVRTEE